MRPGNPEALEQPYDPARVEARWYSVWEEQRRVPPASPARGSRRS